MLHTFFKEHSRLTLTVRVHRAGVFYVLRKMSYQELNFSLHIRIGLFTAICYAQSGENTSLSELWDSTKQFSSIIPALVCF